MVRLVKPDTALQEQYMTFYYDWINSGEDIVPWVVEKDPTDFQAYVDFLYAEDCEAKLEQGSGFVPHSTYWLLDGESRIVGAVNIRHRLNQKLLESGGHIGYGISPSHRRKGYAGIQLSLALNIVQEMGLKRVLLVCDNDNEASERTIRSKGGKLDSEFTMEDGTTVKRFWIELK